MSVTIKELTEQHYRKLWLLCKYNASNRLRRTRATNNKFGEFDGLAYIPQDR